MIKLGWKLQYWQVLEHLQLLFLEVHHSQEQVQPMGNSIKNYKNVVKYHLKGRLI